MDSVLFSAKETTYGEFIKENSIEQGGEFPRRDHATVRGAVFGEGGARAESGVMKTSDTGE